MTKFYFVFVFYLFYMSSCKTAGKAYEKGNYIDAIERSVKKLAKDPNDSEAKAILQNSYTYAVNEHENQVRILSESNSEQRFDKIYSEYKSLQNLYDLIRRNPASSRSLQPKDYSEYLETYRNKAADIHEEKAMQWMNETSSGKTAYREAYYEFNKALEYRPDKFELKRKRDSAYNNAITKVLVVPIQYYGGGYSSTSNSYQLRNFNEDILRTLSYNAGGDFVKFYSEWDMRNKDVEADQILELNLNRVHYGQPYDERSTREVSKEVVTREIVYKPDSIVKEYGRVTARITTVRRTIISQGDLYITIRDTKGRTLWNDRFTGEHRWQTEYSTFSGDERALSGSDRSQLNRRDYDTPREEEIMEELLRQIQHDLSYKLKNYFSRF